MAATEPLKIYLAQDVIAELRRIAEEEDRTVTGMIRQAVRIYLDARLKEAA